MGRMSSGRTVLRPRRPPRAGARHSLGVLPTVAVCTALGLAVVGGGAVEPGEATETAEATVSDRSVRASADSFPGRRGAIRQFPLGRPAPPLGLARWVGGERLEMEDLRGQVVLVRRFTDTCPFCSTTAPVLDQLDRRYRDRGLRVIGVFHPKPPGDERLARAAATAERFGFDFPVALDADWSALERWWLDHVPNGWTSVTFLVGRDGRIRHVHPGGEFHPGSAGPHWRDHTSCNREYEQMIEAIERLLSS